MFYLFIGVPSPAGDVLAAERAAKDGRGPDV